MPPHGWGYVCDAGTPQAVGRGANPQQLSLCSGNCQSPPSSPGKHGLGNSPYTGEHRQAQEPLSRLARLGVTQTLRPAGVVTVVLAGTTFRQKLALGQSGPELNTGRILSQMLLNTRPLHLPTGARGPARLGTPQTSGPWQGGQG